MTGRRWTGLGRALGALACLAILAVACGEGTSTPADGSPGNSEPGNSEPVRFPSADGVSLEGRIFGEGAVGVVLSHMLTDDQTSWWDFAEELADEGYLVLTYDFRGFCPGGSAGCSEADPHLGKTWRDVVGAVEYIRTRGAQQVMLVGSSLGGTASLMAAAQEGVSADAVVALSALVEIEGMELTPDVLRRVTAAELFIAGTGDGTAAEDARTLYEGSPRPKRVEILTTFDHGTEILEGNQAGRAHTLILDYLERYADA